MTNTLNTIPKKELKKEALKMVFLMFTAKMEYSTTNSPDGTITMEDPFSKGILKQKLDFLTKVGELNIKTRTFTY